MKTSFISLSGAAFLTVFSFCDIAIAQPQTGGSIPLPSTMALQDYEVKVFYPWLNAREYAGAPGWKMDRTVRDTGPFIQSQYFGTHPAVRIHYSPEMVDWLEGGRTGPVPNGAIVIKEMFNPPAALYGVLADTPSLKNDPKAYEALLADLLVGWTVMIRDSGGESHDGWFYGGPFKGSSFSDPNATSTSVDNGVQVPVSGFGSGTCIRCHASAEDNNTFSSLNNFMPGKQALQFKTDESWRSREFLEKGSPIGVTLPDGSVGPSTTVWAVLEKHSKKWPEAERKALFAQLNLPPQQRPLFTPPLSVDAAHGEHGAPVTNAAPIPSKNAPNDAFLAAFSDLKHMTVNPNETDKTAFTLPSEYTDHVYPGVDPKHYMTASNCYGCHGGLGGAPSGVSMFVSTGKSYGEGYNLSPFGEWRWSPMGLAGRDPIFHAQLESEMIILLKENGQLKGGQPASTEAVATTQQAVVDTCLRCHGAMGLRQMGLDEGGSILNPHFDPRLFYLTEPLTAEEQKTPSYIPPPNQPNPPVGPLNYAQHDYGELARDGISCAVCHHIAPPDAGEASAWADGIRADHPKWIGDSKDMVRSDILLYSMAKTNTGIYQRSEATDLLGPFDDVKPKPMQHAMGTTPKGAPPMEAGAPPFTADSAMCGTCHTINLPNIGATEDKYPVLTAMEPNTTFQGIPHGIEQATYLEWVNSLSGPGKNNLTAAQNPNFKSCQDCHMPNQFTELDGKTLPEPIDPLVSQIATIQDSTYAQAEHQLPAEDIDIPLRPNYRRHQLVGLNAFMIEMTQQFPSILGVDQADYESGATNGSDLAIDNMALSIKEGRVATVAITDTVLDPKDGTLVVDVEVVNKTGHRFPSGVAFRRAWVALTAFGEDGSVLWSSGAVNEGGLITDSHGDPLPSELLTGEDYQPNHQVITQDNQVQIYEELVKNASGEFTTSFIHRVTHIKDNRLLAPGWVPAKEFAGMETDSGIGNQGEMIREFMASTDPTGVEGDPDFARSPSDGADHVQYRISPDALGKGKVASIEAKLYYQSFMPAWFYERFQLANEAKAAGYSTPETDRLFYLAGRLNVDKTLVSGWKIEIASDAKAM
ncbi:hypothetical protein [Rhodospirillum sp. A1_3_36]|uniref:hypothetical protein n=1 Tax=Rhodospirillum sp. A1_3_36 TaxID=3391666 RepID=UPI0039A66D1C